MADITAGRGSGTRQVLPLLAVFAILVAAVIVVGHHDGLFRSGACRRAQDHGHQLLTSSTANLTTSQDWALRAQQLKDAADEVRRAC